MFTGREGIPEEIVALGRASVWKKQPEEWEETLHSKIEVAKEKVVMAMKFLDATTHIPCAFYSQVSTLKARKYGDADWK